MFYGDYTELVYTYFHTACLCVKIKLLAETVQNFYLVRGYSFCWTFNLLSLTLNLMFTCVLNDETNKIRNKYLSLGRDILTD